MPGKVRSFTDLDAWIQAHRLVLMAYEHTKKFPLEERYGLTAQSRRAAVSISSNVAEGFSRRTAKDKAHFYSQAHGSLTELHNQIIIARDLRYITVDEYSKWIEQTTRVEHLIVGLSRSCADYPSPPL